MAETLSKETLTPKDKKLLEETLAKNSVEMNEEDKGIIRARRAYLSPIELEIFKDVLADETVEEEDEVVDYAKMTVSELHDLCFKRGVVLDGGEKKKDLVDLLKDEK